jgi:hypothetical protein
MGPWARCYETFYICNLPNWPQVERCKHTSTLSDSLRIAATEGHVDIVDYLANHGADINSKSVLGLVSKLYNSFISH